MSGITRNVSVLAITRDRFSVTTSSRVTARSVYARPALTRPPTLAAWPSYTPYHILKCYVSYIRVYHYQSMYQSAPPSLPVARRLLAAS